MDDDLIFKYKNIGLEPNRYELINKEYLFKFKWEEYNLTKISIYINSIKQKTNAKLLMYNEENNLIGEAVNSVINKGWNEFCFPTILGVKDEIINLKLEVDNEIRIGVDKFGYTSCKCEYIMLNEEIGEAINSVSKELQAIKSSNGWRFLNSFYKVKYGTIGFLRGIKNILKSIVVVFKSINKSTITRGAEYLKDYGFKAFILKVVYKLKGERINYMQWLESHFPTLEELEEQRKTRFDYEPLISILMPTYKTPKHLLIETIESVINQTYSNWEFCIADGNSQDESVNEILNGYAKKDSRFKIKYLSENKGIAGNTQECYYMAQGDYIGLFDHDDLLEPNALYEIVKAVNNDRGIDFIYTDEDKINEKSDLRFDPHFKQDFSIDTFRSCNYICHFSVFRKDLMKKIDGFRDGYNGSQDYDIILRATDVAENIHHIPKILYSWRVHSGSTAGNPKNKMYCYDSAKKALDDHLRRNGIKGKAHDGKFIGTYDIEYEILGDPKVSIIIDGNGELKCLDRTIKSIQSKSTYKNYEIIIVTHNICEGNKLVLDDLLKLENIKVIESESTSIAELYNVGARHSDGDFLVFINNDMEVISESWIERLIGYAQREDVGCVGCKLYYKDNTIQHGGIIIGIGGAAAYAHRNFRRKEYGYFLRLGITHNLNAVSGDCLMVKKELFNQVNGFDTTFKEKYYDVDFCLRIRELNKVNVWTPFVELYNYRPKIKGSRILIEEKDREEFLEFGSRYEKIILAGDPYYSPNLTLEKEDFSLRN